VGADLAIVGSPAPLLALPAKKVASARLDLNKQTVRRKADAPGRLRVPIRAWQTHSWTKKIVEGPCPPSARTLKIRLPRQA